ncbi:uncharacterized protein Dvir_GJ25801 [Drosophila virilis]|uniref:Uncharacterized protein n=1 Tax=Drosophila virilis TaxID=7244 RepID=A0A0Q9WLL2_DROVI|nr:uncharacterized protein Dvir_GJ25801 [Drosophila virilis]
MEPEIVTISSDEDASNGDTEPFPGLGGRPRDPRQGREYYGRGRQEETPRQFRHTLYSRRTNVMERLDVVGMLMAVEIMTMFVEAPSSGTTTPLATGEVGEPADEEEPQSIALGRNRSSAQSVAMDEEKARIFPSALETESAPMEAASDAQWPRTREANRPFRRRFTTHRLEADPESEFPRITLRYLPKVPEEARAPRSGPSKRGRASTGEGPGGKRRRSRHRRLAATRHKRHQSGSRRITSPEMSPTAPKKFRSEAGTVEGPQLRVPRSPRERQEGPSHSGMDNRSCGATPRGGRPEPWLTPITVCQIVVEEPRCEDEDDARPHHSRGIGRGLFRLR